MIQRSRGVTVTLWTERCIPDSQLESIKSMLSSNRMPCLPHETTDNPKLKMRTIGFNNTIKCSSSWIWDLWVAEIHLVTGIILWGIRMRICSFNVFEKRKQLKFIGFLFLTQKTAWYSGKSLELGFRSHKCFMSDILSPYPRISYSITLSLNWLMETIFLPHGVVVRIKHNNACEVSFPVVGHPSWNLTVH